MTDKSPTQAALDRDTQIEELARENERLRNANEWLTVFLVSVSIALFVNIAIAVFWL